MAARPVACHGRRVPRMRSSTVLVAGAVIAALWAACLVWAAPSQALVGDRPATPPSMTDRGAGDGYTAYVACSHKKSAKPSHECKQSQSKAAFFVSKKHDAVYKVCVKFPGKKRLCASAQTAAKGEKRSVTIT